MTNGRRRDTTRMSFCLRTSRLRKNTMLTRSAAEDVRRLLSAWATKILSQRGGLCEAWGFQDDVKCPPEMLHGSLIGCEQFCSSQRRPQCDSQRLTAIQGAVIV